MRLDDDNFLVHAMHVYDNPQCHSVGEFEEDLKRFLYLKKLFARYTRDGELRERLILNHIIVLYNLFGDPLTEMLFFKIDKEHWPVLATFLVYLNRMPEELPEYGVRLGDLPMDVGVIQALRKI